MPTRSCCVATVLAGLFLAACTDSANDPLAPGTAAPAFAAGGQGNGKSSLELVEGDYAVGLLDRDNANRYRQYAVSRPENLVRPSTVQPPRRRTRPIPWF